MHLVNKGQSRTPGNANKEWQLLARSNALIIELQRFQAEKTMAENMEHGNSSTPPVMCLQRREKRGIEFAFWKTHQKVFPIRLKENASGHPCIGEKGIAKYEY